MNHQLTPTLMIAGIAALVAQQAAAQLDSELVAPGASVVKLADGFVFTEGPAVDADGNIYFTDVRDNKIHKWTVGQGLSTFSEDSGNANGLFFDANGNLLACESGNRRITRLSMDGSVTVLADSYDGKKLNSPNDIWPDPRGGVYFSDPRFFDQTGVEQDGNHVYYIPPDGGPVMRVVDDFVAPNGVLGTADGRQLYVADHGPDVGRELTYVYDIEPGGRLANGRVFARAGSDGMTLDEHGNVYLTAGGVEVYSPDGRHVASIPVPELPSNVVFGGPDRRTLFITARTGFYALEMAVRGQ
jgi:gluconolactonase